MLTFCKCERLSKLLSCLQMSVRHSVTLRSINERPEYDFNYLLDTRNTAEIRQSIRLRKGVGDIDKLLEKYATIQNILNGSLRGMAASDLERHWNDFYDCAALIPNRIHPDVPKGPDDSASVEVRKHIASPSNLLRAKTLRLAEDSAAKARLLYRQSISSACGDRAYAFVSGLARLEKALVRFALQNVCNKGFTLVSVPDILNANIPVNCGLMQRSDKDILYRVGDQLPTNEWCLSGTGEIGIAGLLARKTFRSEELPLRFCTVSRCYRPEISGGQLSGGIYRVHEFTKVEMFVVSTSDQSEGIFNELVTLQERLFQSLELDFRILDMPTGELGAPAYRKFDMEAWLPGRNAFGEISSTSNCTDFQARRLAIKHRSADGLLSFVHTLNGTALAVPRIIIAMIEQKQLLNNTVPIPTALQPFFGSKLLAPDREKPLILKHVRQSSSLSV